MWEVMGHFTTKQFIVGTFYSIITHYGKLCNHIGRLMTTMGSESWDVDEHARIIEFGC
jgi:hypothetical protein